MVATHWPELRDREIRYHDHTWQLTGDVDVREQGSLLTLDATQTDGVRHEDGALCFDAEDATDSLNPGNLGEHFDRVERGSDAYHLYVKKDGRTYPYVLQRLER